MDITAYSKLNLYLKIIRKRSDGFHEIETLFERISLFDRLSIKPSAKRTTIICDNPLVPVDNKSLLGRTVEKFKERYKKNIHFDISLKKRIPIGAGLGGASSDAAALLKGLNKLTGVFLEKDELLEIGRTLGADVPFFLCGYKFGLGKGRGDIIEKISIPVKLWHVLITPPFGILTKEIYAKVSDFGLTNERGVDRIITAFLEERDLAAAKNFRNDLQTIVLRSFPMLEEVFRRLNEAGSKGVLLSGSGSTVFGIFKPDEAVRASVKLKSFFSKKQGWQVNVACTT